MFFEMYSSKNLLHQNFVKEIMKDPSIQNFLGNIGSETYLKNCFFLKMNTVYVGLIAHSPVVETQVGKTVSIYYAIAPKHRHLGYGTSMLKLFIETFSETNSLDKFILNIKKDNFSSQQVALKCGFQCVYEDDEDKLYSKDVTPKKKR